MNYKKIRVLIQNLKIIDYELPAYILPHSRESLNFRFPILKTLFRNIILNQAFSHFYSSTKIVLNSHALNRLLSFKLLILFFDRLLKN